MIRLQGKTIYGGIASGSAFVFQRNVPHSAKKKAVIRDKEMSRITLAVSEVKNELAECAERSGNDTAREIFEIHRMMLEDEDILDFLENAVQNENASAEDAVAQTEKFFSQMFLDTQDEYMIARIDDIRDICGRLTAHLSADHSFEKPHGSVVLVTKELLPSDFMQFDSGSLKGIVIGSGSVYSHISILIKEMGIPALICENINAVQAGMPILLDADSGTVYLEPDDKTVEDFMRTKQPAAEKKAAFSFRQLPCRLYINIGNPLEFNSEWMEKCDGIGLFRTEYMYFGRAELPDEEEQVSVYREILQKADGKNVTVRTFDVGSDKTADALPLGKEENPALGFRGLRVYSLYPAVFKTQLRALLRAAVYGNLRIMYPMVTSRREIAEMKELVSRTAQELSEQNIPYRVPPQGAMIETPAAALLSEQLAEAVDFFSVGTNDLVQYTLALDRQSGQLDSFCDPEHEAVTALIKMAADNAHKSGIEIGICGELASRPELTETWTKLGIDYLSVSPAVLNR